MVASPLLGAGHHCISRTNKLMNRTLLFAAFAAVSIALVGCGPDNSMTQAEINKAKNGPAMTDADRATVANGMAKGAEDAKAQKEAWAKANADKLAAVNVARAKMGRAPLSSVP